jgi:hypothetical protein
MSKETKAKRQGKAQAKKSAKTETPTPPKPFIPDPGHEGKIITGTHGARGVIDENSPAEKKARANMPIGLRRQKSVLPTGKNAHAFIYRLGEILRKMSGHSKSQEYLELEKDLGFGENANKKATRKKAPKK